MGWTESVGAAIDYIEAHLQDDISIDEVAKAAVLSPYYFQKGFAMLCGLTVGEYIRQRRLSLAGLEVATTDKRIIDIALAFGYESADSFTKAFTRFHGATPTAVRRDRGAVVSFAPLRLKLSLEGGRKMDYRIEKKDALTVCCRTKTFSYEEGPQAVPDFWQEHFAAGGAAVVHGEFGINIDEAMSGDTFEYLIADACPPDATAPEGYSVRTVPAHTWAIFPCRGDARQSMKAVNQFIFSEWLPANRDYEIAAGINIECYEDAANFANGIHDDNYYSEIWIPIQRK